MKWGEGREGEGMAPLCIVRRRFARTSRVKVEKAEVKISGEGLGDNGGLL